MSEKSFELSEEQAKKLENYAMNLRAYHALIGSKMCEIQRNMKQANEFEDEFNQVQEEIAKELKIPRGERITWNLKDKKVEII